MIDPLLMHRRFRFFASADAGSQADPAAGGRTRAQRRVACLAGEG